MIQRSDLEVHYKCIGDGDGFSAYVDTADPRESANMPLEVHEMVIARTEARTHRDYQKADALLRSLHEAGYRYLP
nr:unnamed protein product [Digitaria exilis]